MNGVRLMTFALPVFSRWRTCAPLLVGMSGAPCLLMMYIILPVFTSLARVLRVCGSCVAILFVSHSPTVVGLVARTQCYGGVCCGLHCPVTFGTV